MTFAKLCLPSSLFIILFAYKIFCSIFGRSSILLMSVPFLTVFGTKYVFYSGKFLHPIPPGSCASYLTLLFWLMILFQNIPYFSHIHFSCFSYLSLSHTAPSSLSFLLCLYIYCQYNQVIYLSWSLIS